MARPKKIIDWETVDRLAKVHAPGTEIAAQLGIHADTLGKACVREHKMSLSAYLTQRQDTGKAALRELQWKTAQREEYDKQGNLVPSKGAATMQIWLGKQWLKQHDKLETIDGNWAEKQSADDLLRLGREALAVLEKEAKGKT